MPQMNSSIASSGLANSSMQWRELDDLVDRSPGVALSEIDLCEGSGLGSLGLQPRLRLTDRAGKALHCGLGRRLDRIEKST
jgi:hypothetical protein